MRHPQPAVRRPRLNRLLLMVAFLSPASTLLADCAAPDLDSDINSDATFSGQVFLAGRIDVANGGTLTFEPGTEVVMCDASAGIYVRAAGGGGILVAEGTADQPIVFRPDSNAIHWDRIQFNTAIPPQNRLRHVVLQGGGGSDPDAAIGALQLEANLSNAFSVPVIDNVRIVDSGANGAVLRHASSDPTPAPVSNLTVTGAAGAPLVADTTALGTVSGENTFEDNGIQRILVTGSLIDRDTTWSDHGVPYELTDGLGVRTVNAGPPVQWTLEAGVTVLVPPSENVTIGSNSDAVLVTEGTAEAPVLITRLDDTADYWGRLLFSGSANHRLEHTEISWGGQTTLTGDDRLFGEMIRVTGGKLLFIDGKIAFSESNGVRVFGGLFELRDSELVNNEGAGLAIVNLGRTQLSRNHIVNNALGGVFNTLNSCVEAIGNYWGDAGGPADDATEDDACGAGDGNGGFGDAVSQGVRYTPWLTSANGGVTNRSQIRVLPRFVIADGVNAGTVTATIRDLAGNPLPNRTVRLASSLGTLDGAVGVTDRDGRLSVPIRSSESGYARLTGFNETDGEPIAGVGGVTFWQGPGDTGGLINPNGSPYARPELRLDRPPFITGFPMDLVLSLQNTRSVPLDVTVDYGVSRLHIGVPFTPVDSVSKTLQPGERWDARGLWVPNVTGHHCVEALVSFDDGTGLRLGDVFGKAGGSSRYQKNSDPEDCEDLNPWETVNFFGTSADPGKNQRENAKREATKANKCINTQLTFNKVASGDNRLGAKVDKVSLYTGRPEIPELTPPVYQPGGDFTPGLAASLTDVARLSAEISALVTASGTTRQRLAWAAQARDQGAVDAQYFYFRSLAYDEGLKRVELGSALLDLLAENEAAGIPDSVITPDDQAAFLETLKTTGYPPDVVQYMLDLGWDQAEIDRRLEDEIATLENMDFRPKTDYEDLRQFAAENMRRGQALVDRYQSVAAGRMAGGGKNAPGPGIDPITYRFRVGHDRPGTETVRLLVRPLQLPIDWSWELETDEVELGAGEIREVSFVLVPGPTPLPGEELEVAVEGWLDDELLGGISFEYRVPQLIELEPSIFNGDFEAAP